MKKYIYLSFLLSLLIVSCSQNDESVPTNTGTLQISTTVNDKIDIITTRADADVNNFKLVLQDEKSSSNRIEGLLSGFPNGFIENISASTYTLTLTSHPNGFTPAFEEPTYEGIQKGINIISGQTTNTSVECLQSNAGVYFIYDSSLKELGLTDITPIITQGNASLTYSGEHKESKGYFLPENAVLKIANGTTFIPISGLESQVLELQAEQLWEIKLKAKQTGGKGNLVIVATVRVISSPTNHKEFELEKEEEEKDFLELSIDQLGATYVAFLMKGTNVVGIRYDVLTKSELEQKLAEPGKTLDSIIEAKGYDVSQNGLKLVNSEKGYIVNFAVLTSKTEYVLITLTAKEGAKKAQRLDFTSK